MLGPFEAALADDVLDLGGPKQRAVLALLALRAPDGLTVDGVIDGLWGEEAPEAARSSVYAYVSNLRALLGGGIDRRRGGYVLTAPHTCDADAFEDAVARARDLEAVDPAGSADLLRAALAGWRGAPYADLVDVPGLADEARRLEELRLVAVEARIDADLAAGRGDELVPELRALVAEHPLRERLAGHLMLALYRSGRQAEALREYRRLRELLAVELGVDPSPELQVLEERILRQDESLATGSGQVTTQRLAFLFTDIEGSTRLWDEHRGQMAEALALHDEIIGNAVEAAGGSVAKHTGDGAIAVFTTTDAAADAAEAAQRALAAADWGAVDDLRVRMAVDVGDVDVRDGDHFGPPLNRGARILGATHGGQVVLSSAAFDDLSSGRHPGLQIKQLGTHHLRGLGAPERLAQLVFVGLPAEFPDVVTEAAPADLSERLEVGGLPGYELRERLGRGVWGSVHRAYQPSMGREVAVRVIASHVSNHPSFVRRFEAHAKEVAALEHPHIVPLYDFWRDYDGAYLVMQLMRGGSLDRAMHGTPWEPPIAARLLRQVGSALAHAHDQGAVHGDIRPQNVLLDGAGNAFVSDFGLSAGLVGALDARPAPAPSAYRSPEARAGDALDGRADVYSLAVVAHALLTGQDPPLSGPLPPVASVVGDPSAVDGVLLRGSALDPDDRYPDVATFIEALEEALGIADLTPSPPVRTGLRNPYKGLRAFGEADAGDFHGRADLVATLVDAVGTRRLVAVVGPSGSGKSSAVQAGLVPRLRAGGLAGSEAWFIATLAPGPHPLAALADALRPLAMAPLGDLEGRLADTDDWPTVLADELLPPGTAELVVVVDQLEELFTVTVDDAERGRFLDLLAAAAGEGSRVRVVVALRADFYDRPLEHTELAGLVADGLVTVVPPTLDELVEAIERPARTVGLGFEPGLPMRIAGDVVGQPGGLPLVQFALTEMVDRRGSDLLSGVDYEAIGTVRGAVARRAEAVYAGLDDGGRAAARDVLLRLVSVDEEADDTRRRVRLGELAGLGHHPRSVDDVLAAFGRARLFSFDRDPVTRGPTVEVAHEALLRAWDRLRGWIEGERETLILARRLRLAMDEWEASDRGDAYLLTGDRLGPFRDWPGSGRLNRDESDFLAASVGADDAARSATRRRRGAAVALLALTAVVMTVLAGFALTQRNRADDEAARAVALAEQEADARQEAETQAAAAEDAEALAAARELAASAVNVADTDPQLAMLLALEALDVQPAGAETPVELRNALRQALHEDRLDRVIPIVTMPPGDDFSPQLELVAAPDGSAVAVAAYTDTQTLQVFDPGTWERVWTSDDPAVDLLALAPGADRALVQRVDDADGATTVEVLSLPANTATGGFSLPCPVDAAAWSPDGALVALVEPDCADPTLATVRVRDTDTGSLRHELPTDQWTRVEFIDGVDGPLLVYTDFYAEPGTTVLDAITFEPVAEVPAGLGAIAPDGSTFLGLSLQGVPPTLVEVATGTAGDRLDGLDAGVSVTQTGYFSPDGRRVAVANEGSLVPIWDVATGRLEFQVPAGSGADVAFVDADTLVTAGFDGTLKVWDLSLEKAGELGSADAGGAFMMHGLQAGSGVGTAWVVEPPLASSAVLFDAATGTVEGSLPDEVGFWPAAAGDAGAVYEAADGGVAGPLRWWSAATGETVDVDGCWADETDRCPDGSPSLSHSGFVTSVDGREAGALTDAVRFRVWRDGPTPVEDVTLALDGEPSPMQLLMAFSDQWVVVRTDFDVFDVFERGTGELLTTVQLPNHYWLRFDRGGTVGVGAGFSKTLSVLSTDDWEPQLLTDDLGEGTSRGLAVSPSGDRVAVGVMDGFVRVFETDTGTLLDVVPIEAAVALHWLDDTHIAAATAEGLWTVLTLDVDELEGLARDRVYRDFTPNECALYRIDSCG